MVSPIETINPNNSATFYHRIGISISDSKIYRLAKSFFTKIGQFFSTCMRFCGEKFNAFKEKVSPPPQQQTNRVPHKLLEEDNGTELREWLSSGGSNASSAPQSQALIPYVSVDLERQATRAFINESREERTDLGRLRQAGADLALRGMGPRAEQFAQFKKYLAQNPIQAFQFPIQALQFQRDALANRG